MTEEYELYVLDDENRLTLYNTYKVESENIYCREINGNVITFYQATNDTRIVFANNGVTIVNPQSYKESFTQGLMRRKWI